MFSLENIVAGAKLRGIAGPTVVEVVRVEWSGSDALNVVYRGSNGPAEVLLFRDAEQRLELVQASRTFSFDGDGEAFRIASEAQRIRLAHLFDPYLAVHSSRIEPLPHQITAVYGEMLPRQPLRFLLADDPGAGKTIMAGLLIKELIIRGDLERCLIIAPGNLVEQWQDELKEKFDLTFDIVSREQIETSVTGNPFVERSRLIRRLDMAARSETLQAKLQAAPDWDLIICDEAHRMAASLFGNEVKYTNDADWLKGDIEKMAMHFAIAQLVPEHLRETRERRLAEIDRVEGEVRARLKREINYWDGRAEELALKEQAGKGGRLNSGNARAYAQTLTERLDRRLRQLTEERDIQALPPLAKGAALVVPIGLLGRGGSAMPEGFAEDALARKKVELLAMEAVMAAERALGREPRDVSSAKVGYDIESRDPTTGHLHFIEVKGRIDDGETVTVTTNEMLVSLNSGERFVLAIVSVGEGGFAHQPVYVRRPFDRAPDPDACSTNFVLDRLIARGREPH